MDGVLISSREAIAAAWSRVAGEQGVALGPDCLRDHVHGRPGGYTLDYLFGHLPMERRRILKQRVDALEEGADCPLLAAGARWSVRDFRELRIVREDDRLYCQHRHPATTGSERSVGVP